MLWYVNLEDPLVRTPIGFDYLDRLLDIEIAPDLSRWKWKDEDELEEAVARGILTSQEAHVIRAEGESVIAALDAGHPPFDEPWDRWRPDPCWPTSRISCGLERPMQVPGRWREVVTDWPGQACSIA